MSDERIKLLQGMPVFGGIREDTLKRLLEKSHTVNCNAGEYFLHQGDQATSMFVLESGKVDVVKTWEGKDYLIRTFGIGDSFGEMSLVDFFPRSASIRARDDCDALEITHSNLFDLYGEDLEQFTIIQMNIGREISRRLRALEEYVFQNDPGVPWSETNTAIG